MAESDVITWLLDSDPALRWQVERDLAGEAPEVWQATRARVATEGFGARLLSQQGEDGQWAGGAYFPADASREEPGQPWTATSWSLSALREWGVDPAVLRARRTAELLAENCRWEYDDLPFWDGEVDCCINAATLSNGTWLGVDVSANAEWFVEHRLPDGGWNCDWVEGARRSSVHSTINALAGLLDHEVATGGTASTRSARRAGGEYLLERRLRRRRSTGELIGDWVDHLTYPFRWPYSTLRALDHFRRASAVDRTRPDDRLAEAVDVLREARRPDGTWLQGSPHVGRTWFEVDAPEGEPSKWLTLYGMRVLSWWDGAASTTSADVSRSTSR
jgi:hypothetical protein